MTVARRSNLILMLSLRVVLKRYILRSKLDQFSSESPCNTPLLSIAFKYFGPKRESADKEKFFYTILLSSLTWLSLLHSSTILLILAIIWMSGTCKLVLIILVCCKLQVYALPHLAMILFHLKQKRPK
jgi:hypothetical protein